MKKQSSRDLHQVTPLSRIKQPSGLYVHIPFCRRKCAYCDFFSITDHSLIDSFVAALRREADMRLSGKSMIFDSLYIGGGTPSVFKENQITEIIEFINKNTSFCINNEITVEANPESVNLPWLKSVRKAGVNRVSIGVQSFNDGALAFLGRIHNAGQARQAVMAARDSGFDNIGLDIIYGLPGQTLADLESDLNQAVSFLPEHISCYMLTLEAGTPLEISLREKAFQPLSESLTSDMFLAAAEFLTAKGYLHYEISNFARSPDTCSRHNTKYWQRIPYVGLGPSAHSYSGTDRCWNVKEVPGYVDRLVRGLLPELSGEVLSVRQQMMESLYLGLRLAEGIEMEDFNREFGADFQTMFTSVLSEYQSTGLLEMARGRCSLSARGMLFHETIVSDLTGLL